MVEIMEAFEDLRVYIYLNLFFDIYKHDCYNS